MIVLVLNLLTNILFFASPCQKEIRITDLNGNALSAVTIKQNQTFLGQTNEQGILKVQISNGKNTLFITQDLINWTQKNIDVDCNSAEPIRISIENKVFQLDEVNVKATTAKEIIDRSPFSVQAIDLREEYHKGGDVSELLNRASGVKLRSDGNIGSTVQINLGGLQGKAVKIFKDGIPIELFGHGFSLGTIPVNMLERVEIYKGVMPLYLAADALGGGVNLVTRNQRKSFAEASYEIASFNTHRATTNFLFTKNDKYIGANASFNYSDNDYKVNVPIYDYQTSKTDYQNKRRFHDAVRSYYTEIYAGIKNKKWTDDLRLTLIASDFYKEIQHDAEMNKVYGEPYSKEQNYTALLNYKKTFLNEKLKTSFLNTYSHFNTRFIDTATVRYDWNGNILGQNLLPGEINQGNNQRMNFDFYTNRLNISYDLSSKHTLESNQSYYWQRRKGSDPLGAISVIELVDVLTIPATYQKYISALGLRSNWLNKKVETIVGIKYYQFNTKGYTTDKYGFAWRSESSKSQLGYLGGIRWNNNNYMTKFSYEYATRLPDEYEVFGDARMTKENLDLKPERSHNLNLNAQYTSDNSDLSVSAGVFYRRVKDIIFLQLDIPFNRYINYEEAEIKGFEVESNYAINKQFNVGANLTYQDIRRVNIKEAMFKNLEDSRVPNVPFLFGNFWSNYYLRNVFQKGDKLDFNWNANYTHRFFLTAISKAQEPRIFGKVKDFQTSLIIPRDGRLGQFSNNIGVYYAFSNQKVKLSGECRNLFDVRLYDNFNVQKPGRSFHLKLVYQFY